MGRSTSRQCSQPDGKAPAQTHRETQRNDYQASYMAMVYSLTRQRGMYDVWCCWQKRAGASESIEPKTDRWCRHKSRSEIEITPEIIRAGIDTSQNLLTGRLMLSRFADTYTVDLLNSSIYATVVTSGGRRRRRPTVVTSATTIFRSALLTMKFARRFAKKTWRTKIVPNPCQECQSYKYFFLPKAAFLLASWANA